MGKLSHILLSLYGINCLRKIGKWALNKHRDLIDNQQHIKLYICIKSFSAATLLIVIFTYYFAYWKASKSFIDMNYIYHFCTIYLGTLLVHY